MPLKKSQRSLKKWTKQKWTTPSGKKSYETGKVYAPKKQNQKIFDVLDKLEHKQYELCEKHCKLADRLNDYEEKFVVRKVWLDDCA